MKKNLPLLLCLSVFAFSEDYSLKSLNFILTKEVNNVMISMYTLHKEFYLEYYTSNYSERISGGLTCGQFSYRF